MLGVTGYCAGPYSCPLTRSLYYSRGQFVSHRMNDERGSMTQLEARQVKAVELDILTELDRVCREHQLSYALAYGTLIGAMRHSGFIPWDDDIDVYMPRDDYEKLYDLWKQGGLGEHYSLVSYRDRTSINSYCKLVDTRTRAVESFLDESAGNLGLWVDIFPLERVDITDPAVHRAARTGHRLVWWKYIAASNPRYATSTLRRIIKYMLYPITRFADLYAISRRQDELARACHRSSVENPDNERYVLLLDDIMSRNIIRPEELFPTRTASFEGREFAIPAQAEKLLEDYYGDWRAVPPEDQRPPAHMRSVEWVADTPFGE